LTPGARTRQPIAEPTEGVLDPMAIEQHPVVGHATSNS
jgi:hypothetical protein